MALSSWEIMLIIGAIILLFGAPAIPKLARSVGQAKGEFAKARREFDDELKRAEVGQTSKASEDQIRRTARELGIQEEGRNLEDVKRDVAAKLG